MIKEIVLNLVVGLLVLGIVGAFVGALLWNLALGLIPLGLVLAYTLGAAIRASR